MSVELYYFQPLGTNSGRVFLSLLEKGVPFVERELDGLAFEHLQPAYLAVNPKGQVPALVHDGRTITEGGPTCEYIDEAFDGPPLRPLDARERWRMRWWQRMIDIDFGRAMMMIHWNRVVPMFVGARDKADVDRILASVPDPDRRRAWTSAFGQTTPQEAIEESRRRLAAWAGRIEAALAEGPWLAGETFSLADIELLNFYGFMPAWMPDDINETETPCTMAWLRKMEERPAVRDMRARTKGLVRPPAEEKS